MPEPTALKKAAIVVASLDRETADRFLEALPDVTASLIRDEVLTLSSDELSHESDVIREFLCQDGGPDAFPSAAEIQVAAPSALDAPMPAGNLVGAFSKTTAAEIARQLATERPQTIAIALSTLVPERASEVLAALPNDLRATVVGRIHEIRRSRLAAADDVLDELERVLGQQSSDSEEPWLRLHALTAIPATDLTQGERELAMPVEPRMTDDIGDNRPSVLNFDDLMDLDSDHLASVLHACDPRDMLIAIWGGNHPLMQRLQSCLSSADFAELEKKYAQLGTVSIPDVHEAQQRIAKAAKGQLLSS